MHNPAVKVNHPGVKIARTISTILLCEWVKRGCLNIDDNMHFKSIMHKVTANVLRTNTVPVWEITRNLCERVTVSCFLWNKENAILRRCFHLLLIFYFC